MVDRRYESSRRRQTCLICIDDQLLHCQVNVLKGDGIAYMTEMREVRLPADLCAATEKKFAGTFSSVEELLLFILRDLSQDEAARLDQAEQSLVEQRLRDLGYL